MCVLAYGTSSPSMASMPGCSAVRGCGSSSISVALTYSRKGASACLPDVRSTNVLSASQRPTRRMTSKSTQPSSKSARGASCAEVVSQRVLHAHTEKNGASSVRHASLPFGLKRSPPAYCRCASISQRACVGREGGVSACRQRCGTSERPPEGPHVEASLAHPAEVLRAEVEVRGEGPLHREEAVEEAPLRRLRDAHHVEPLSIECTSREVAEVRMTDGSITSSRCRPPQQRRRAAATGPVGSPAALSSETHSEFAEPPGSTPIERAETAASASSRAKRPLTSSCTTPSPPTHTTASTSAGSICAAISLTCPACVVTTSVSATRCASKRGRQRA
mmetsp:Transcript_9823/g.29421  ORF Transcript_9823/g.29421 Transcript_9823/m.29421 type:complete len:334 (-) Transcript_9823:234-1235(-)